MKTSTAQSIDNHIAAQDATHSLRAHNDMSLVRDVPVHLTAKLGTASLTIERLFALKQGDVVELDQALDDLITFYMGDKPIARGSLVAAGDRYGIELIEIM